MFFSFFLYLYLGLEFITTHKIIVNDDFLRVFCRVNMFIFVMFPFMNFLSWIYWNPQKSIFTIPVVDHPVSWYGVFFAIGFICSYFISKKIFGRICRTTNSDVIFEGRGVRRFTQTKIVSTSSRSTLEQAKVLPCDSVINSNRGDVKNGRQAKTRDCDQPRTG